MNAQPSKSSRWNHSPKTSKIASSRPAGVARAALDLRAAARRGPALLAQLEEGERRARPSSAKCRYSVIFATPDSRDDRVDADRADPVAAEQLVGGLQDALARSKARACCRHVHRGDDTALSHRTEV